jgi:acetylornithine deacetylase/succinyl-diaminopimelate desuccinylase-like protein
MSATLITQRIKEQEAAAIARLIDWLRIPSVSTDPAHAKDCRSAAEWAAGQLRACGLRSELRETGSPSTPGHPIVWATTPGPGKGPHVLFYGHYDVQPADPLELWESPPFEPVIKPAEKGEPTLVPGERIVARGAVDDKGQVMCFIEALRAWHDVVGGVPIKLTVLLEGEEESGSVNLGPFLKQHDAELRACDVCVISDTGMLGRGKPAITYGVRGLAYTECILHGPNQDLHSGLWGGRCPNPANELVKVLAQLWDADRRITIPGFYDAVRERTPDERKGWARLPFNPVEALQKIGYTKAGDVGEAGWTAIEREWARPTAEINGIFGGYTGVGAKTVIGAKAAAKVSFRLVADQDPEVITKAFKQWLDDRTPPGCRWEFHNHSGGFPGNVATDSPYLKAAARAVQAAAGSSPHLIKSGGSIPVVGMLKSMLDLDTILLGFGLDDDRVHSPNEKFELECFRLGIRSHAHLIDEFSRL